jgi:hypothetical protein
MKVWTRIRWAFWDWLRRGIDASRARKEYEWAAEKDAERIKRNGI